MAVPSPDDSWFKWALGVGTLLLSAIGKRFYDFLRSLVTRRELTQLHDDRVRMHEENQATLERIEAQLERVHERVDDVWKKVPWS